MESLSGGERNRVYLAKLIKSAPNLLFLDEPTNDLDVDVLRNLENALMEFAGNCFIYIILLYYIYFLLFKINLTK